jgi:endonuclease/exonuclease/phosphatase family metal-dependent hydrolase
MLGLQYATGGPRDPLLARRWRANIDHAVVSRGLRAEPVEVWPEQFPLSRALSDHHGMCVGLAFETEKGES